MSWYRKNKELNNWWKEENKLKDVAQNYLGYLKDYMEKYIYYGRVCKINRVEKTTTYDITKFCEYSCLIAFSNNNKIGDLKAIEITTNRQYVGFNRFSDFLKNKEAVFEIVKKEVKNYKNKIAKNSKRIVEINYKENTITIKE
jgi:hypothetical protein